MLTVSKPLDFLAELMVISGSISNKQRARRVLGLGNIHLTHGGSGTFVPGSSDAGPFNGSRHDVRTWGAWRGSRYRKYGVVQS